MVPLLLAHLDIAHVSLASHSGGDIYLLNTLLTYPSLLHPETPYVCFFAPWVVRILLYAAGYRFAPQPELKQVTRNLLT